MRETNWFATVLIAISLVTGISAGVIFGSWAIVFAVVAAIVGTAVVEVKERQSGTSKERS